MKFGFKSLSGGHVWDYSFLLLFPDPLSRPTLSVRQKFVLFRRKRNRKANFLPTRTTIAPVLAHAASIFLF